MRRISLVAAGALAAALLVPWPAARADDPAPAAPQEPEQVHLVVGEALAICGRVICPAATRCDDPALVDVVDSAQGPTLVARAPGKTVCSATGSSGVGRRWVFRLVVDPAR